MLTSTNSIEFSIENIIKRVTSIIMEQAKIYNLKVNDNEFITDTKYIRKIGSFAPSLKQDLSPSKNDIEQAV